MSRNDLGIRNLVAGAGLLLVVLAIGGCAPSGGGRLFPEKNLVGAGFEIDWTATEKGIAFLVEEKKNRVLKTQSIEQGEKFSFSVAGVDSEQQFQALFGVKFAEARFSLYFVPEGQEWLNE